MGGYLATLDKRVLVIGSGGLSHDPPVPTLATALPAALDRIVHGAPMSAEARLARQSAVIDAAHAFAHGDSPLQPLNPAWDATFLEILDEGRRSTSTVVERLHRSRGRQLGARDPHVGGGFRGARGGRPVPHAAAVLPRRAGADRRVRDPDGGTGVNFDRQVDVLVVGSGGGGMTAALTAHSCGLDTLVVEKSAHFGGSTALSGGGIWVPGAPSQRKAGYTPDPDGVFDYLKQITGGLVTDARLRTYVDAAPQMMEFLEDLSPWFEFVWKPGYADYYPELPGGSELGSTINARHRPAQAR